MKNFMLILVATVLINVASGVQFEEEDVYDDDYELTKERSYSEPNEEKLDRPNYDINDAPKLFEKFKSDYNKKYKTKEDSLRHYGYFLANLKEIIALNKAGGSSVSGINMFTDYSEEEYAKFG